MKLLKYYYARDDKIIDWCVHFGTRISYWESSLEAHKRRNEVWKNLV